jgi:4-hydroxybutyrate CoA-transferase
MATAARLNGHADWRAHYAARMVTAEEAAGHIKSGDRVALSIAQATPFTLCPALAARLMDLEDVVVNHGATLVNWDLPGLGERFRLESNYLTPFDRAIYHRGSAEFTPISYYRTGVLPPSLENFNVYIMTVSPPDEDGYCNFGDLQIMSKLQARAANLVIAEIDPSFVRIGGDNSIHVSEIDWFVERKVGFPEAPLPQPSAEEQANIATICQLVAKEFVRDRATLQVGVGSASGMLMHYLGDRHDLGVQTEIIPYNTANLVRAGVVTGKYKKLFPGLVVGSGFAILTPREELEIANGHPAFQLYDFNLTDDIRLVAREDGIICVNNALAIDLTGQANSESIGHQMYTGTGGQTAFAIAASLAGGKSILVTPSTSMVKGTRVSRIVAGFPPGSVVTTLRTFVHYVVTEYGVAKLMGKSIRERARELIAVAHPDFRGELAAEAARMYG